MRAPQGWEDFLEEGMAIHSSILAQKIPWTLAGCSPWGHKRVGHDLVTKQHAVGSVDNFSLHAILFKIHDDEN